MRGHFCTSFTQYLYFYPLIFNLQLTFYNYNITVTSNLRKTSSFPSSLLDIIAVTVAAHIAEVRAGVLLVSNVLKKSFTFPGVDTLTQI